LRTLGATGIELQTDFFKILYNSVKDFREYDQVIFYEFGRNFWLFHDQLEYKGKDASGAVTTGNAFLCRFWRYMPAG